MFGTAEEWCIHRFVSFLPSIFFSDFGVVEKRGQWGLFQGRSQGRVPGVLEPPFWVMKINIISRGKKYRNPPFEIPRDEIFVFEEEQKKINIKGITCSIAGYNIIRVRKLDGSYKLPVYRSLQCGTFPLAAQVAKRGSSPTQCSSGIRKMQPWILSKRT